LYLSGHPLDKYRCAIETTSNFKTSDIDYEVDEETGDITLLSDAFSSKDPQDMKEVKFIAVLNVKKEIVTKKKDLMAMLEVEDLFGTCKVTVFPGPYEDIKPILKLDEIYQIRGKVSYKQGDIPSVIATSMTPISQVILKRIIVDARDAYQCKDIAKYIPSINVSGNSPVYLQCGKVRVLLPRECWVDIDLFFRYLDREVIAQEQITIREW
jgi:DNA polymerase-3 subunit alpha